MAWKVTEINKVIRNLGNKSFTMLIGRHFIAQKRRISTKCWKFLGRIKKATNLCLSIKAFVYLLMAPNQVHSKTIFFPTSSVMRQYCAYAYHFRWL